jgi:hypothetical protein
VNLTEVFNIRTKKQFEKKALEVFGFQAEKNSIYKKYVKQLGVNPANVKSLQQIPFLPIEFFKTQKVITNPANKDRKSVVFQSSGTTGMVRSKHYVFDRSLYENSFRKGFDFFYGKVSQYYILAFLPSYYENKNSSLLYMVNDLVKRSGKKESRFYKNNEQKSLLKTLDKLLSERKKVILFGVSNALLDLAPSFGHPSPAGEGRQPKGWRGEVIVLETGGMKGKREEITREKLHETLAEKFGVKKIHSEYGMTELLSQAYSKGDGIFKCPPWMKIMVRDANDPFSFLPDGKTGAVNIIDLANIYSCSFIAAQDVGRVHANDSFEILGRMDNSDLRGCNLLAE